MPEKPVIRFATPIVDRGGEKRGILIINLHAAYVLEQIEQVAERGGVRRACACSPPRHSPA